MALKITASYSRGRIAAANELTRPGGLSRREPSISPGLARLSVLAPATS
jgi:hypothetical protein